MVRQVEAKLPSVVNAAFAHPQTSSQDQVKLGQTRSILARGKLCAVRDTEVTIDPVKHAFDVLRKLRYNTRSTARYTRQGRMTSGSGVMI